MHRILLLIIITFLPCVLFAQPQTTTYQKENDFVVAVLNNPTFSIYDFLTAGGLNERNTQILSEDRYHKSKFIQNKCKELYGQYTYAKFHDIYRKISASWTVFKEVQYTDLSYDGFGKYMMKYSTFDPLAPRSCPNPELKHKLSIVPLKLK
jgi:hypothetical protein